LTLSRRYFNEPRLRTELFGLRPLEQNGNGLTFQFGDTDGFPALLANVVKCAHRR
jgi:hypothetical protein